MAGGRRGPHKSPPTVLAKPVGWLIAEPGGERERQSRPRQWRACPSPPRYPCRSEREDDSNDPIRCASHIGASGASH